jgi:dihydrofolate reductase
MARVIAGMTTSLDGFVADPSGSVDRLYPDLAALQDTTYMKSMIEETGAVVMGRTTFGMGEPDWYVGSYEFQVPIFVVTHTPPRVAPKQDEHLTFTFVTDGVESAVAQAKAAAGGKGVQVVGGVSVIQQLLRAGLVDELHIDFMPVLLGAGRPVVRGHRPRARPDREDRRARGRSQDCPQIPREPVAGGYLRSRRPPPP